MSHNEVVPLLRIFSRRTRPTCPFCKADIHDSDEAWSCTKCKTPHHLECARENRKCTALGCGTEVDPSVLLRVALPDARFERFDPAAPPACRACSRTVTTLADLWQCQRCAQPYHRSCGASEGCRSPSCTEGRISVDELIARQQQRATERHRAEARGDVIVLSTILGAILLASAVAFVTGHRAGALAGAGATSAFLVPLIVLSHFGFRILDGRLHR